VSRSKGTIGSPAVLTSRLALLTDLGGLPDTGVRNDEWLYMLQEETRQSLSIEGYFATERELKAVLAGRKSFPEILNYFRAAQDAYDLALQQHREQELGLTVSQVRHVHSELFRDLDGRRGEFRRGGIVINQAKVTPPSHDVPEYVRAFVKAVPLLIAQHSPLAALARLHVLFESIHPFPDGNGRAGRILLNFVAVSLGLPPIIIKGMHKADRERYYTALEAGDAGFHDQFAPPHPSALLASLEQGHFGPLETLLLEGITPQLDALIVAAVGAQEALRTLRELAPQFGVQEATLRQWVIRGKLLATKRGGRLVSHPRLLIDPSAD
jgi:fido (protein-threonine AMPylation protein)